jgi:dipeptidyl aminopeptidase/acylaminoacyl peptidase
MKWIALLLLTCPCLQAQQLSPLTVEKIMRDPKWMGVSPTNPHWSADAKTLYFTWNPENNLGDSLYAITLTDRTPKKVSLQVRRALPSPFGIFNKAHTKRLFDKNGDLFLQDVATGMITTITNTLEREYNASFSIDETRVFFMANMNLFSWDVKTGSLVQHTDFKKGTRKTEGKSTEQERWLKADQLAHMAVLERRATHRKLTEKIQKADRPKRPKEIYIDEKNVESAQMSPDGNFITYRTAKNGMPKSTIIPNYVTESGFTEDISSRSKVGVSQNANELFVYDIAKDTVYAVKTESIPGIFDAPSFRKDYSAKPAKAEKKPDARAVTFFGPLWSDDGRNNIVVVRSVDNKDRWIMSLDLATMKLKLLDRQHDDAWIGGPGTGFLGNFGWLGDNVTAWFQSEESGYSHLYAVDVSTGKKRALTAGHYEVQLTQLSRDKKFFYITTNEVHPGEKQLYKLPVAGGPAERITSMTGSNEVTLSPDEKWIAIRYSYSNKPWELFLQENKAGAKAQPITTSSSAEFKSYPWRDPEVLTFKARDGADVYTRLFKPANPNGAAVIFVHGAGYLQNAHKWWSSYFREYMFNNLLADKGYTVLDMDYRASAGYGRDWRTGIYRFMGGKDLTDQVDGAKWLVDNYKIDSRRIGIYGGSYGGFITLMALFTTPDVFAAGAALRPVTDWAHYNHGYTSGILNEPFTDSIAYAKSSPIYYADGLKGSLLICHGMVDTNVHFQDAVRLTQRLIELGKDNWELAVYPVEDHGFVEASSWTDEYKRILKLFEEKLK